MPTYLTVSSPMGLWCLTVSGTHRPAQLPRVPSPSEKTPPPPFAVCVLWGQAGRDLRPPALPVSRVEAAFPDLVPAVRVRGLPEAQSE